MRQTADLFHTSALRSSPAARHELKRIFEFQEQTIVIVKVADELRTLFGDVDAADRGAARRHAELRFLTEEGVEADGELEPVGDAKGPLRFHVKFVEDDEINYEELVHHRLLRIFLAEKDVEAAVELVLDHRIVVIEDDPLHETR